MKNLLLTLMFVFVLTPALNAQCVDCPACGTEKALGFLEKTSNSETVFEVKQKEIAVPNICLPSFRFNLRDQFRSLTASKCCPGKPCGCPTGDCPKRIREGKIKVVKVLSKKKVKCEACAYEWEVGDSEHVNEYWYGKPTPAEHASHPTAENKTDPAVPSTPVDPAAPTKKVDPVPNKINEAPLMEVPAAPKMGWRDKPFFQPKKKESPISFAPQKAIVVSPTPSGAQPTTIAAPPVPFVAARPSTFVAQPATTKAQPAPLKARPATITAFPTTTSAQPAETLSQPKAIKALPVSTNKDAFLIRKPGPPRK